MPPRLSRARPALPPLQPRSLGVLRLTCGRPTESFQRTTKETLRWPSRPTAASFPSMPKSAGTWTPSSVGRCTSSKRRWAPKLPSHWSWVLRLDASPSPSSSPPRCSSVLLGTSTAATEWAGNAPAWTSFATRPTRSHPLACFRRQSSSSASGCRSRSRTPS